MLERVGPCRSGNPARQPGRPRRTRQPRRPGVGRPESQRHRGDLRTPGVQRRCDARADVADTRDGPRRLRAGSAGHRPGERSDLPRGITAANPHRRRQGALHAVPLSQADRSQLHGYQVVVAGRGTRGVPRCSTEAVTDRRPRVCARPIRPILLPTLLHPFRVDSNSRCGDGGG